MTPNGVLYLTKVSRPPNPFVSTGKIQIKPTDEKTTFFRELSLYPQVVGVATRPKDINILFKSSQKHPWTGNRLMRIVLEPHPARYGPYGDDFMANCGSSSNFNGIAGFISAILCKNC